VCVLTDHLTAPAPGEITSASRGVGLWQAIGATCEVVAGRRRLETLD
jgi:hypothetical protein